MTQIEINFSASELIPPRDGKRIARQRELVWAIVRDGDWHTPQEISGRTNQPGQSVTARLRELRDKKHGGYLVLRRWVGNGVFEYRVSGVSK